MRLLAYIFLLLSALTFLDVLNFKSDPHNYFAGGLALISAILFLKADVQDLENKVDKLEDIRK